MNILQYQKKKEEEKKRGKKRKRENLIKRKMKLIGKGREEMRKKLGGRKDHNRDKVVKKGIDEKGRDS